MGARNALKRLSSSPRDRYTYGDSAHLHAATIGGHDTSGNPYMTMSYDAAGDMTCRARTPDVSCATTPQTGAQLTYDAERRMTHWQSTPSSPATTEDYLYDGAGQRIQKKTVSGTTTTVTSYIGGGIEEAQSVNGGAVTLTKYLGAPGMPQAIRVGTGGSLSYLANDGLSTVSEALDSNGNVTAQQLYIPYGGSRYSNGTMPTAKGFTGQQADSTGSKLDYYGARYYDPVLGQFASADTAQDGLNRYGYVHGNPTTFNDPSGHMSKTRCFADDGCFGGGDGTCHSDASCGCYDTCGNGSSANDGSKGDKPKEPTEIEKCNADPKCKQQKNDDSAKNFKEGGLWFIGELATLVLGCGLASAGCGALALFLIGPMQSALHSIFKGLREFEELNGVSPYTRMLTSAFMLLGDIMVVVVNAIAVGRSINKLRELTNGIKSLGGFIKATFTRDGLAAGAAAKNAAQNLFNFSELQEDASAFNEAANEWVTTSMSSGGYCDGQVCPTPVPVPTPNH